MYVFSKVKAFVKFGVLRETILANTVYKNIFSLKLFMKQKKDKTPAAFVFSRH